MTIITTALPALDDARIAAVAQMVQSLVRPGTALDLTDEELAAVERSKADFKAGRTLLATAYEHEMNAFMSRMATEYPAAR